jgi:hypothetical protein
MTPTTSGQSSATSGHDAQTTAATAPVTVEQAAAILGVSITTVKRRIRTGSLRAEQAQRPQGTVWLVYLDAATTTAAEERSGAANVVATAPTSTPAADAMVSLIQATIRETLTPIIAPLVDALERQAGRVAELERENGQLSSAMEATAAESIALKVRESRHLTELVTLRAELERAAGTVVALGDELEAVRAPAAPTAPTAAPTAPAPATPTTDAPAPHTRFWWLRWLLALTVALVVVGVLLFLPR